MNESQTAPAPAVAITAAKAETKASGGVLWTFTLTTFLSALLLFSIQPMFAKMVLPVLGGAPSVWAVAMCFFQAALLAGYCWAHLVIKRLPVATGGLLHLALCLVAFVVLPIGLPAWFGEPPQGEPYLWQLGLFAVAVGLPFLAVSANAPLLQSWFSATGHPQGSDPYFLYAASNLGSLIALLGYPFVLEPAFGLKALSVYWTLGYAALVAALALCFWLVRKLAVRETAAAGSAKISSAPDARAPTWSERMAWVGLALIPSALLTAFTTHVTTDVASAPLLWVLPLSLYLLTFVLTFREKPLIPTRLLLWIHLAAVVAALLVLSQTKEEGWFLTATTGVIVFFASAMVAHRTLYEARPDARHLTEFYLWMSLGGALGGLSAALIAPKIFPEVFEYPLLLALSMACRPGAITTEEAKDDDWWLVFVMMVGTVLAIYWVPWAFPKITSLVDSAWPQGAATLRGYGSTFLVALLAAGAVLVSWRHPTRQLVAALMMFMTVTWLPSAVRKGEAERSYFGVYRVMLSNDGEYNILIHGTTLHGAQRVRDEEGNSVADVTPSTYYYENSPMAQSVVLTRERLTDTKGRYGVIGLGAGSLACHSGDGEDWRFFEIDPVIIGIARDSGRFTYIESCLPKPDIVIGDARLTMTKEADQSFDLLIVDAFSSDAIPVHLMTAESIRLYVAKLKPDGVVLLHISNRYLDLEAVLGATITEVPGAHGLIVSDDSADGTYAQSSSTVGIFAKSEKALEPYRGMKEVRELARGALKPWTDDYSDVLGPFMSQYKKRFGKD
jgi:hypothetical protein